MQTNSVICHMVAKECQELQRGGCEPSLEKLSACVYRLGGRGAVEEAFQRWLERQQHIDVTSMQSSDVKI